MSGAYYGSYAAEAVIATWGEGIVLSGFADGTFVEAERASDGYTKTVGATGEVHRNKNADKSGKITVRLLGSSWLNMILSEYALVDDLLGGMVFPFTVRDLTSLTTVVSAENAWIVKIPKFGRAKELELVEWVFECANLEIFQGGTTMR